ncbi:MAG: Flp1 family type IVb pilin [Lachnospiraceae bacterium]|nr:Flp1 family type IVb pilin [Lachnospiraceae bacterium]
MMGTVVFNFKYGFLPRLKAKLSDESGMGTIEVVLILVVLIALVIIFKEKITALLKDIMGQIETDAESVYSPS